MSAERSVVITGASSGIGAACARYLDERGFTVWRVSDDQKMVTSWRAGAQVAFVCSVWMSRKIGIDLCGRPDVDRNYGREWIVGLDQ